jgi:hypothetical protein
MNIIRQYNGYVAVAILYLNGELTEGENIAYVVPYPICLYFTMDLMQDVLILCTYQTVYR